jgi:hypothetical protein
MVGAVKARAATWAGNELGQLLYAILATGARARTERHVDEKTLPHRSNRVPA